MTRVVRDKRVVRDSSSQARGRVDMRWESGHEVGEPPVLYDFRANLCFLPKR